MKTINIDQIINVPIRDEQIGASYDMEMTVSEFFEKFCREFKPEITESIPLDWFAWQIKYAKKEDFSDALKSLIFVKKSWEETKDEWEREQASKKSKEG